MDFEAIASTFSVKPEVIETLFNELPFKDIFDVIVGSESPEQFWKYVDSLPRSIAMMLHSIELKINVPVHDFPEETVSPILQSFWAANLISEGKTPETVNPQSITQISMDQLYKILEESGGAPHGDSVFSFEGYEFQMSNLLDICNSSICHGMPWFFCEMDDVRAAYCAFSEIIQSADPRFAYLKSRILEKMRNLAYASSAEMIDDASDLGIDSLPEFEMPSAVHDFYVNMISEAQKVFEMPLRSPQITPMNDWIKTRAESLVAQMALPLQQRSAFVLTPQILQARSGMPVDNAFDPLSLPELLFSNSNGDVCPMPFATSKVELPATSPTVYARSVFRKAAAKIFSKWFKSVSDIALDVLADVMMTDMRKIAQYAVETNDIERALRETTGGECGCDFVKFV